jgi:hypothetical protein
MRPGPPPPDYRGFLYGVLRRRGGRAPGPDHPPPAADDILAVLGAVFPAGSPVGVDDVVRVTGITPELACAVRSWAARHGAWPWTQPSPVRPAARRREGGGQP